MLLKLTGALALEGQPVYVAVDHVAVMTPALEGRGTKIVMAGGIDIFVETDIAEILNAVAVTMALADATDNGNADET